MDFKSAINRIMPDVNSGSKEPFIVYRDKKGWHCDHTQNQYGERFDWVEGIKEQDCLALEYKGSDFNKSSYQSVYESVLSDRVRSEYQIVSAYGKYSDNAYALAFFFGNIVGDLPDVVTDYLTTLERPLAALTEMCPHNLFIGYEYGAYDEEMADKAVSCIENAVYDRLHTKDKPRSKAAGSGEAERKIVTEIERRKEMPMETRREVEGYKEINSMPLARRLVLLCENQRADEPYMVCNCRWDNPLGINDYYDGVVTADFLEAVREYIKRIDALAQEVEAEQGAFQNERKVLTADDCIPHGLDDDLTGKLIVIRPDVLSPEYRSTNHQIKIVTGGFGASPNSRGNAVFCKDLYSGRETRFERYDVAGVIDPGKLPEWAVKKLALMETPKEPPAKTKAADKKPSLLGRLDDAKAEAATYNEGRKDAPKTKKRGEMEVE